MSRRNLIAQNSLQMGGGVITFYVHLYVPHVRPNYPPSYDKVVDFICERGMTFRDLINSEYNVSLTPINSYGDLLYFDIITLPNTQLIGCKTTTDVYLSDTSLAANLDDVIIENTTYETTQ